MIATGQTVVMLAVQGDWLALVIYGTCLAGALLAAAAVIEGVRRWRQRGEKTLTASDQLATYRALYNRGEISQEEFDRLRDALGGEIRRAAAPPAPPPAAPASIPQNGQSPPTNGVRPE
jgi:uncharacterized membrane protein